MTTSYWLTIEQAGDPALMEWIRVNGIDPGIVPAPNILAIDGRVLWLDVLSGGRPRLDPDTGQIVRVRLSFPILVPWLWPEAASR